MSNKSGVLKNRMKYQIGSIIEWPEYPGLHWRVIDHDDGDYLMRPLDLKHAFLRHYTSHLKEDGTYILGLADGWTTIAKFEYELEDVFRI